MAALNVSFIVPPDHLFAVGVGMRSNATCSLNVPVPAYSYARRLICRHVNINIWVVFEIRVEYDAKQTSFCPIEAIGKLQVRRRLYREPGNVGNRHGPFLAGNKYSIIWQKNEIDWLVQALDQQVVAKSSGKLHLFLLRCIRSIVHF